MTRRPSGYDPADPMVVAEKRRLLGEAPPLTPEQMDVLRAIFGPRVREAIERRRQNAA